MVRMFGSKTLNHLKAKRKKRQIRGAKTATTRKLKKVARGDKPTIRVKARRSERVKECE